jgi:hypothetical protein
MEGNLASLTEERGLALEAPSPILSAGSRCPGALVFHHARHMDSRKPALVEALVAKEHVMFGEERVCADSAVEVLLKEHRDDCGRVVTPPKCESAKLTPCPEASIPYARWRRSCNSSPYWLVRVLAKLSLDRLLSNNLHLVLLDLGRDIVPTVPLNL